MWITAVNRPDAPEATLHQFLWGYFPGMDGQERPFLFRTLDTTILMLSRVKPSCPSVDIKERITAGNVYQFDVLASPRNGFSSDNGGRYRNQHHHKFIRSNQHRKEWFGRRLAGAEPTFMQIYDRPDMQVRRGKNLITRPACIVRGTIKVNDRAEFMDTLQRGIGGGGVWGFGLMVLPEVMSELRN